MTRREMTAALGASLATLLSGTVAALRAESAEPLQNHRKNAHPIPVLLQAHIGDPGDCDARMLILNLPPKFGSAHPHMHSGPVFAYVLEGEVENQVDPGGPQKYSAGDYWYEPAMHVHRVFRNPSDQQQARILVFQLMPKGKPSELPAK